MRILFMGTSSFAVPTLKAVLSSRHQAIAVVTQPDRPKGRGKGIAVSPVKEAALEAGLTIYQPEKVGSPDFISMVRDIDPDAFVVAAFGQILPKELLGIPRKGSINVHASLLPKYRGAAPVHYALFNGEKKTGVTTMIQDPGLDTGPILLQCEVEVLPDDNEGTLEARLAEVGAPLLVETLDLLEQGLIEPKPQDDTQATKAPSVKHEQCAIDWNGPAETIVNRVRGCTPRPGAYTFLAGSPIKIWLCVSVADKSPGEPGQVVDVTPEGILVSAGESNVLLQEVQPENRKRMPADAFARGYSVARGTKFADG